MLKEGTYTLSGLDESRQINNEISEFTLDGPWQVSFDGDWGGPERVEFPELISWTDSDVEGIKYYSGIARYEKTFEFTGKERSNDSAKIILDLGETSKVGEVWLNGENMGTVWKEPYQLDVTGKLTTGENSLVVEVANTWSNRLVGDALLGEDYTNTNIRRTIIPVAPFEQGDQTRYEWKDVPLIRSGLLGPVRILGINEVREE